MFVADVVETKGSLLEVVKSKRDEIVTGVVLYLPFALQLRDGKYPITLENKKANFYVKKVYKDQQDVLKYLGPYHFGDPGDRIELVNDKYGRFAITKITFWLPFRLFEDKYTVKDGKVFLRYKEGTREPPPSFVKDRIVDYVNKLIGIYRYVTEDAYIGRISVHDFIFFKCMYVKNKKKLAEITYILAWEPSGLVVGGVKPKDESTHQIIEEKLQMNVPDLKLHKMLLLNAKDYLTEKNTRLVLIESRTALENFVTSFLITKYKEKNISIDKIKKALKIHPEKMISTIEQAFDELRHFDEALKRGLDIAIEKRVSQKPSLWKRYTNFTNIRNKVVHQDYIPTISEAKKSINTVEDIMEFIRS